MASIASLRGDILCRSLAYISFCSHNNNIPLVRTPPRISPRTLISRTRTHQASLDLRFAKGHTPDKQFARFFLRIMASATGIPDAALPQEEGLGEDEPLLGRPGDASQPEGRPLYYNLIIGTAVIAQAGIILLTASVWASVFLHPLNLFAAHPLLNSAGLLVLTQSILVLQPTHTPAQKRKGTIVHFTANNLALDLLVAGLVIIEYNKFGHNGIHFESPHAILGLITYILLAIQATVGFTAYFVPRLYGGVDVAKSFYKWHRLSGYLLLTLMLATVTAATQTDYNQTTLHIRIWAILISAALVLAGVLPRIKKQKLGLEPKPSGASGQ